MTVDLPDGPSYLGHPPPIQSFFAVLSFKRPQNGSIQYSYSPPDERQRSHQPWPRLSLLYMGPYKMLTIFLLQIQCFGQLPLVELPSLLRLYFSCGTPIIQHCDFFWAPSTYTTTLFNLSLLDPSANAATPPWVFANAAPLRHPCLQTFYPLSAHFVTSLLALSPPPYVSDCSSTPPAPSSFPDSLRALPSNAGGFRARSTELLHLIFLNSVDLICIQESNLNSSSFVPIPGYSAI